MYNQLVVSWVESPRVALSDKDPFSVMATYWQFEWLQSVQVRLWLFAEKSSYEACNCLMDKKDRECATHSSPRSQNIKYFFVCSLIDLVSYFYSWNGVISLHRGGCQVYLAYVISGWWCIRLALLFIFSLIKYWYLVTQSQYTITMHAMLYSFLPPPLTFSLSYTVPPFILIRLSASLFKPA